METRIELIGAALSGDVVCADWNPQALVEVPLIILCHTDFYSFGLLVESQVLDRRASTKIYNLVNRPENGTSSLWPITQSPSHREQGA